MKVEAFIPAVFLLCFCALMGLGTSRLLQIHDEGSELKNYLSWEDLRVVEDVGTERSFSTNWVNQRSNLGASNANANAGKNSNRVIVVDKRGRGDSVTVQGAVDMVPDSNSHRVKIFILPGFYR